MERKYDLCPRVSMPTLDLMFHNPPPQIKHTMKANNGNHQVDKNSTAMASALLKIQMHMYDILARWNLLAEDLGIDRWVVHGGSAMGAKCFGKCPFPFCFLCPSHLS